MKTNVAYVQTVKGKIPNANAFNAYQAFDRFFGYKVQFFETEELDSLPITKDTPVYAGIPVMKKIFAKFGKNPEVPYYPDELGYLLDRKVEVVTLDSIREDVEERRIERFIKPLESDKKLFTGHVVRAFKDLIYTAPYPGDMLVYSCELVEFITEYRCFIHKERGCFGVKHYWGDWTKIIDCSIIDSAIKAYKHSPIAYSLDLGLTSDGRTLLVECNDASSLGCYGLSPSFYGTMIIDRWNEVCNS